MSGALSGSLVLDLSRLLPGPYCSMILADHGARVIAIEDRRFRADALPELSHINRNKEHMTLNLKAEGGREIFFALADRADIVLEGFRPGVADRLGVGYETLSRRNPRIIYCSLTGYGQNGPLKDQAGHDINFLGASGLLSLIGPRGEAPCIPGIQIGDLAGGLYAAVGILLALAAREKTGHGQYVDVSMTDALMAMAPIAMGRMWADGRPPERGDWLLSHRFACYNVYRTADGKHITVGALEARFWETLCRALGVPEYGPLQYDKRRQGELIGFLERTFLQKTRDQWMRFFQDQDVCIGAVLTIDEAVQSPYARAREMVPPRKGPGIGPAVKLSKTPASLRTPPPEFGADTRSILTELGYSASEIDRMEGEGIL